MLGNVFCAVESDVRTTLKRIADVAAIARRLVDSLVTDAPTKNRESEAEKARKRGAERFGQNGVSIS